MIHQLHSFMITHVIRNHTWVASDDTLPASLSCKDSPSPPSYHAHTPNNNQHVLIPTAPCLTDILHEEPNSRAPVPTLTNTVYRITRAIEPFNSEYSGTVDNTIVFTYTVAPTPELQVNGALHGASTPPSSLCQSRPPPYPCQSWWWATGNHGLRTCLESRWELEWNLPLGLGLPDEGSISSNGNSSIPHQDHRSWWTFRHHVQRPSASSPTPVSAQGVDGDWDCPLMPPADEPWEGLPTASDAPPIGDGASTVRCKTVTMSNSKPGHKVPCNQLWEFHFALVGTNKVQALGYNFVPRVMWFCLHTAKIHLFQNTNTIVTVLHPLLITLKSSVFWLCLVIQTNIQWVAKLLQCLTPNQGTKCPAINH